MSKYFKNLWGFICFMADFFIPRFVTEDVVVDFIVDNPHLMKHFEMICYVHQLEADEKHDGIITVRSLHFLFWAFFAKPVSQVRPFMNPYSSRRNVEKS